MKNKINYPPNSLVSESATISASGDTTGVIDTYGMTLTGIITPSALTGTSFTFLGSDTESGTYVDVVDKDGNDLSVTVKTGESEVIIWGYQDLKGLRFIKIKSSATEAAEREIKLILSA